MKISSINSSQTKNINHKAGKVRVFSDFDRTFLPTSHAEFQDNTNSDFVRNLKEYFANFKNFKEKNKKSIEFTITTGRTFDEFKKMAETSREKGYGMPLPDSLIVKNGSDEHLRLCSDKEFYETGKYPFQYTHTNKGKEDRLFELTGWNGEKLKEKLREILEKYNLRIVESGSEHSVIDYGKDSFFAEGNIPYEGTKVFKEGETADWVAGLRKDGNCKIYLTYPFDMDKVPERSEVRRKILNDFGDELKKLGVRDCYSELGQYPHECGGRPWQTFEPMLDYKLGAKTNGCNGLTKLFDTKEALRKAEINKDLVIAAGDSSNDLVMLNPILYFENSIDKYNRLHPEKPFNAKDFSNPKKFVELLDSNKTLEKEFMELPFVGIIVTDKENKADKSFKDLIDHFANGKYKKLVVVKNGELQKGINEAIKLHCEKNTDFKNKLNNGLKEELFGKETPKITEVYPDAPKKSKNKFIYIALGIITLAGIIFGIKTANKKENQK